MDDFSVLQTDNNLDLHIVNTPKFKTNLVELYLARPLSRETASQTALLPYVLYRGSSQYPTSRDFEIRLEELYGADLNVSVLKRGEIQLIRLSLEIVNEGFLPQSERGSLQESGLQLLNQLVFQPLFKPEYVEQEKEFLTKEIQSLINDKYSYAVERCFQEMCSDEPFGTYKLGDIESIKGITTEGLNRYYRECLVEGRIFLLAAGAIDQERFREQVSKVLEYDYQQPTGFNPAVVQAEVKEVKEEREGLNVQQGKLCLGFRTGITRGDSLYYALMLYNGILGSYPHSLLFQNVREKASLAYFAHSQLESTKGLLLITAGIDFDKYRQAREIILQQVQAMSRGDFSDDEVTWSRKALINQMYSSADSIRGLTGHYLLGLVNGVPESIENMVQKLKKVSREEIVEAAQQVKLDTVYFLDKKGEQGEQDR